MTYEVKRFDLLTVFKVSFLIYLTVGFLLGILYGLILMKMISAFGPLLESPVFEGFGQIGVMAAFTLALFIAVFMAVIWSVITVIAAGIYNLLAGWVGGLRLELAQPQAPYYIQSTTAPPTGPPVSE